MSKKHKKKFQKQKRAQLLSQLAQAEGISSEQKSVTSEQQTTPAQPQQPTQPQPVAPSQPVTQPPPITQSPHATVTDLTSQSYIPFVVADIKKIAILIGALVIVLIALFFLDLKFDCLHSLSGKISSLLHIR